VLDAGRHVSIPQTGGSANRDPAFSTTRAGSGNVDNFEDVTASACSENGTNR